MNVLDTDIETYGACYRDANDLPLPRQTCWHPQRAMGIDKCPRESLVLSTAITLPMADGMPFTPDAIDRNSLTRMRPGETLYFLNQDPSDHNCIVEWYEWADVLIGHNIAFDILWLRAFHPDFNRILNRHRILLVDTSILNYLHNEDREERSQKALVRLFQLFKYERTLSDGLFKSPRDPHHRTYNCADTHANTLLCTHLAQLIDKDFPDTDKATTESLQYFSDCLWSGIEWSESGIPMDTVALDRLEWDCHTKAKWCRDYLSNVFNLTIGGPGTMDSRRKFLATLQADYPKIFDDPRIELTNVKGDVSWTKVNRDLILKHLPSDDDRRAHLQLTNEYERCRKMITSFTCKLLRHRSNHEGDRSDLLITPPTTDNGPPTNPNVRIGYTSVRIVPSPAKDDSGDEYGQRQGRPSFVHPPVQTFPPAIRATFRSRFEGGIILARDQSQHELRTAAMLSGDPRLCKAYRDNLDLHEQTAIGIWGPSVVDLPTFKRVERQAAKHSNFTMLNRGGWDTLQATILKKAGFYYPAADCRRLCNARREVYPVLLLWQDSLVRDACDTGYLHLPITGHSRCFLGITDPSKIVNFPIQCVAAVTVMYILNHFHHNYLPDCEGARSFLNLYDAGWVDCPTERSADLVADGLKQSEKYVETHGYWARMCDKSGHFVPLAGDLKLIRN